MRKVKFVLGLGIVLGVVGGTLLAAFGVMYVKPYMTTRDLIQTTCHTTDYDVGSKSALCTCAKDASISCMSKYPCLKIYVNYTTRDGQTHSNVTLYDSYNTHNLQSGKLQCSYHKCVRSPETNEKAVLRFQAEYGEPGMEYTCYYNATDSSYAVLEVTQMLTIIHCMFWPSLALLVGFIILLVYLNDPSEAQNHFNSLERPWLRQQARYECIINKGENNAGATTHSLPTSPQDEFSRPQGGAFSSSRPKDLYNRATSEEAEDRRERTGGKLLQ